MTTILCTHIYIKLRLFLLRWTCYDLDLYTLCSSSTSIIVYVCIKKAFHRTSSIWSCYNCLGPLYRFANKLSQKCLSTICRNPSFQDVQNNLRFAFSFLLHKIILLPRCFLSCLSGSLQP